MKVETLLVVSIRGTEDSHISGSNRTHCTSCGAEAIVAPSGVKLIEQGALPICMSCAIPRMLLEKCVSVRPPTLEQLKELNEAWGKDEVKN